MANILLHFHATCAGITHERSDCKVVANVSGETTVNDVGVNCELG